jgi:hypothetical protein
MRIDNPNAAASSRTSVPGSGNIVMSQNDGGLSQDTVAGITGIRHDGVVKKEAGKALQPLACVQGGRPIFVDMKIGIVSPALPYIHGSIQP